MDFRQAPIRWYNSFMDGLVSVYNKISVRTAAFAALVAPVLLFLKDFTHATVVLVSQTFGDSGANGVSDILFNSFSRVTHFDFSGVNSFLSILDTGLRDINLGYLFRLFAFDRFVDLGTWYVCSLLVIWFLRFVWSCFKFIMNHVLSSLPV